MREDIVVSNLSKSFGDKLVLDRLNIVLPQGMASCLTGPSGSGKTTLLRVLMGLELPDSGEVKGVRGVRFSAVFQEDRLIEQMSALRNTSLVMPFGRGRHIAESELYALGLTDVDINQPVRELSGGMRRRVAIARALVAEWDILLLDEPFKGLDIAIKAQVISHLRKRSAGQTVIMVSHDLSEAEDMCARVISIIGS